MLRKQVFSIGRQAAVVALAIGCVNAHAATATANLDVTATISANCTISTSAVAFGTYDPISANNSTPLDATGSGQVCFSGTACAHLLAGIRRPCPDGRGN